MPHDAISVSEVMMLQDYSAALRTALEKVQKLTLITLDVYFEKWSKVLRTEEEPCISVIVPTLNEEEHLKCFLNSLDKQDAVTFEILVVDGGSKDRTSEIARKYDAQIEILPGYGEFISRNHGARIAKGKLLLFTCADVIFPENLFKKIAEKFKMNPQLVALTGPDYPPDAPLYGKIETYVYNVARLFLAIAHQPLKKFMTSTNFLVVRKGYFAKTNGFLTDDINADGQMGKELLRLGQVGFFLDTYVYSSARRMKHMGFQAFNRHYLYALENYFSFPLRIGVINSFKYYSRNKHGEMHKHQ
jgi:glycosyltransferase involved in cell wall biosynthesis